MVQLVNLDLNFAKIGTFMMFLRTLISPFVKKDPDNPSVNVNNNIGFFDDLFYKIRQICQYSIHARPSHLARNPDDIASDTVHNLEAVALGRRVYNLNAFIAPWLAPLKLFFPASDRWVIGIPSRMLHSFDQVIGKITNLFWNVRRVSMGLIPYDGGMKTEALSERQNAVRDLVGYATNTLFIRPYKALLSSLGYKNEEAFSAQLDWQEKYDKQRMLQMFSEAAKNWVGNVKALFNANYKSPHQKPGETVYKKVGSEEPDNHPIYVRSKILSQVIGLPAGLIGGISNSLSIAVNLFGSFVDSKPMIRASDYLTNLANSLMAMVYLTGEVPANLNEFVKRKRQTGTGDIRNLGVAGVGALGMINRIKHAPIIGSLMDKIGIKGILDKFDPQLEKMFLGFFSANRWVLHHNEKEEAKQVASAEDLERSEKHDHPYKQFTLPFRVILGDKDVTYKDDNTNFYRKTSRPIISPAT